MNKSAFIVAALAVTLPFAATSALAQINAPAPGGAAPAAAAPSAGAGIQGGNRGGARTGGAQRGGRMAVAPNAGPGGRMGGGVSVAQQGGGQWAGRQGWNGAQNWNGQGWQGHRHGRVFGPGVGVGIGFGGAYAGYPYGGYSYGGYPYENNDYYDDAPTVTVAPGVMGGGDEIAYCQQRYRSYDINSGTFLGFDGQRHPCP